eukprot:gene25783-33672_t
MKRLRKSGLCIFQGFQVELVQLQNSLFLAQLSRENQILVLLAEPISFPLIGNIRVTKVRSSAAKATTSIAPSINVNHSRTNEFSITAASNLLLTSIKPTQKPTGISMSSPSRIPTVRNSQTTSSSPVNKPTVISSIFPSIIASTLPSKIPTIIPSSKVPSTKVPSSKVPSIRVSMTPSRIPTPSRKTTPPIGSTGFPIAAPTTSLSKKPTPKPTAFFTSTPSGNPTVKRSHIVSNKPIAVPATTPQMISTTLFPSTISKSTPSTKVPSISASATPVAVKSKSPSVIPSPTNGLLSGTSNPSCQPPYIPTIIKTTPPLRSRSPSAVPTKKLSKKPASRRPSKSPSASSTYTSTASPTKPADVTYHNNGSVLTKTVNIYHIYFGRFDSAASKSMVGLMNYFASNIYTLPWFPVLSEYYQYQNMKKESCAHNATFKGSAVYKPGGVGLTISVTDIVASIAASINSGKLPIDQNGVYVVIFRGDFIHAGWLTQWCAYHGSFFLSNNVIIKFAAVGDPSTTADYLQRGIVNP